MPFGTLYFLSCKSHTEVCGSLTTKTGVFVYFVSSVSARRFSYYVNDLSIQRADSWWFVKTIFSKMLALKVVPITVADNSVCASTIYAVGLKKAR